MKKEDLPEETRQRPIKVRSLVMIIDGSYMIKPGEENKPCGVDNENNPIGLSNDTFEVLVINQPYPTRYDPLLDVLGPHNNCEIKNTRTGEIWFCSHINIRNTEAMF